jgi:transcriptional regulator with XRE-family HTH domain
MIHEITYGGVKYVPKQSTPTPKSFSHVLREFRFALSWSLDTAARKIGISKTYLWELEMDVSSDPSFAVMIKIAKAYNIDMQFLADCCMSLEPVKPDMAARLDGLEAMRDARE